MILMRTFCRVKMSDVRLWVLAATLQAMLLSASGGHHRRSMASQQGLPVSKGGWRPVVGSGGLQAHQLYNSFGTAPLHAPSYKIPVIDFYQSSTRPLVKDTSKLTSIAQSYRPTTLRTVSSASTVSALNQPINSYHNPFAVQNNGFPNYKFIQNFPVRNPHNPFGRPVYKHNKPKHNHVNSMLQLNNVQPLQYSQYQTSKPLDIFGNPINSYVRPDGKKPQSSNTEIFKQELYKLPDSETSPQSVSQQVKTAQQQGLVGLPNIGNPYQQYSFQDAALPPNILGTFGSFGIQSVKARDPVYQYPTTKATYLTQQPAKQTIFNSFKYSPSFQTTPPIFDVTTTQKLPTTANQLHYGTYNDFKVTATPATKVYVPPKIDPNAGVKGGFKPSPQDPFVKHHPSDYNKLTVTTYNPGTPTTTTTTASNYYDYNNFQTQNQEPQYQEQQNYSYEKKKQKIHDNVVAGGNQQVSHQYATAPTKSDLETENYPKPTYEVVEATESDLRTQSSPAPWSLTSQPYEYDNQQATEESAKKHEYSESFSKPGATSVTDLPEEYAIVTEAEKGHENSLSYDGHVESQSRRPQGDDFEPIGKHKLKDYYYKVSTASYDDHTTSRRTKRPNQSAKYTATQETTTAFSDNKENGEQQVEALPTLPPNLHFKRPSSTPEPLEKDRVRKRNKIRRRRPPQAHRTSQRVETSTQAYISSSSPSEPPPTTEAEVYTIRPRVRPTKPQPIVTTPTITTDLSTSALPTSTSTTPTIVRKKLLNRRPITTPADKPDTTTVAFKEESNKDSPIMKISTRPHFPKQQGFDYITDYSHKQDEKDTPTSDVDVGFSDTLKTSIETEQDFSFHKDVKPIEAKLEPVRETTTEFDKEDLADFTTTPRLETTTISRIQRPRLRNKYNRTKFNVKDYRSRLSSTTSTTESPVENTPKIRFPQRRLPYVDNDSDNTTERKKFTPKDQRNKAPESNSDNIETTERENYPYIPKNRQRERQTTTEVVEVTTASSRIRQRRPKPTEEPTETSIPHKRPLRKKIKDSDISETVQDISITDDKNEITSERTRSESAIMKIADKKHHDPLENLFEHSKRVSDLTLASSKDYNKPGMFKTVSSNSRRIPSYFTIATDDPILPIEAFFPQLNQKKES